MLGQQEGGWCAGAWMWVDVTSEKREGGCVSKDRDIAEPGGKIVI